MRSATPELAAFLNSGREFVMADLYTITLRNNVEASPFTDVPVTQTNVSGNWFIVEAETESFPNLDGLAFQMVITEEKPLETGIVVELVGWNVGDPRQMKLEDGSQIPDGTWQVGDTIRFYWDGLGWVYIAPPAEPTVLRYTDADVPISWEGKTYQPLTISRGQVKLKRGVQVDSLDVRIFADENNLINGVPLIPFILAKGFDGGKLQLDRAFGPHYGQLIGTLVWFVGRFGPINNTGRTETNLKVNSWLEVLNVNMPRNLYQAPCLHTLYDEGCGVLRSAHKVTGTVVNNVVNGLLTFDSNLTNPDGFFDQGVLVMNEGPDAGVKKTVKKGLANGLVTLVSPLTVEPEPGWTFSIYPGCDHTKATCSAKFNNLLRFRGFPYIPVPETSV